MPVRLPAAQRRRQLLDVALHVFATQGFHRTSMDDVAEAAGVTKPVLYQHFRSKRTLYLELLDDVGTRLREAISKATAEAGSPRGQVEAGMRAYFGFVADEPSTFRLLFGSGARRDDEFAAAVARVEAAVAEAVAALIEADLGPDHQRQLAYAIVGLAEGVVRHELASGRDIDADQLAARMSDVAWSGLRAVHRD